MDKIKLERIKLYAFHGCLDEEGRIGSDYEVDMCIWADLSKSAQSDHLADTVDYVSLNRIIAEEMAIRTKLLEVVAHKINIRVLKEETLVQKVKVKVSKMGPPINGDVERVSLIMTAKR